MPVPKVDAQFIENNIWGNSYTIQPDIPDWINVDLAQQFDLVTYENDLFLTKQLFKRIYKEVFRISGEVIREKFKNTLTQNLFWASHEELKCCEATFSSIIKLLKQYKAIPDNTITQASLLQNVQNISFIGEEQ